MSGEKVGPRHDSIAIDQPTSELAVRLSLKLGTMLDERVSKRRLFSAALKVANGHMGELLDVLKETR